MNILIVEGNTYSAADLTATFERAGFQSSVASSGMKALKRIKADAVDMAIVNPLTMPLTRTFAAEMRAQNPMLPIIAAPPAYDPREAVDLLYAGADDYMAQNEHEAVIVAKAKALMRRSARSARDEPIQLGDLIIDHDAKRASANGKNLVLTPHEYLTLFVLAQNAGQICSRDDLIESLYGYDEEKNSNTIEVFISRLRTKLAEAGLDYLQTYRGRGYSLVTPDQAGPTNRYGDPLQAKPTNTRLRGILEAHP